MNVPNAPSPASPDTARLWALGLVIALAIGFVCWMTGRRKPEVRTTPSGDTTEAPAPVSEYVGVERCAECHADEAAAHARSGHSHTFARTKDSPLAMSLCGKSLPHPNRNGDFRYECDDEGLMASLPAEFGDRLFPIDIALGSGAHAVTFLTLTEAYDAEDNLIGVEHANTWFAHEQEFRITPGQEQWTPIREIEHFGKSHQGQSLRQCIDCHTTHYRLERAELVDVVPNVQCEQCHGPGLAHAEAAEADDLEAALASIHRTNTVQAEITLCGSCHRLPSEIEPDRLQRYPPSLTRFQPVGLLQSRCYLESPGDLTCTTCHDTHGPASDRTIADHVASCRDCHQAGRDAVCSAGHADDCIDCHMRRVELLPGIHFRDHWIRTRPEEPGETDPYDVPTVSGEPLSP